jgi:hypothetical protein
MLSKIPKGKIKLRIVAVFFFLVSLILNSLASTGLIGGNTVAEISSFYQNLFAPAGFTFAIWGVIYLLLGIYCVRQFISPKNGNDQSSEKTINSITPCFILLSILNSLWILAWQFRIIPLSLILIICMFVVLFKITAVTSHKSYSRKNWITIKLPFGIYFGWISVATIANFVVFLVSVGFTSSLPLESSWTIIMLVIGAFIGVTIGHFREDWAYQLVFIWAYFGILAKHMDVFGFDFKYPDVIVALVILIAILFSSMTCFLIKCPHGRR